MSDPVVMECPTCGRLWVGFFHHEAGSPARFDRFSGREVHELQGGAPHAPFLRIEEGEAVYAGFATCHGISESVQKRAAAAAYLLGGRKAAEAMVDYALRDAIWLRELEERAWWYGLKERGYG